MSKLVGKKVKYQENSEFSTEENKDTVYTVVDTCVMQHGDYTNIDSKFNLVCLDEKNNIVIRDATDMCIVK